MTKLLRPTQALVFLGCFIHAVSVTANTCTQADAIGAEESTDNIRTAGDLHKFFSRYSECDDGAIAEGLDEAVARLLTDRWNQVSKLNRLIKDDTAFKQFVLKHLHDGTGNLEDYRTINANASQHCPADSRNFCKLIAEATNESRSDADSKLVTIP